MIIKQEFLSKKHHLRPGLPMNNPTSIVLSWAESYSAVRKCKDMMPHYIIYNAQVFQMIPEHEVARHSGTKLDYSSISICTIVSHDKMKSQDVDTLSELLTKLPSIKLQRLHSSAYYADEKNWRNLVDELTVL
jgi:hypothetical protein